MKLKLIIEVEIDEDTDIIGVKECFATDCEKYGDVKRIEVEDGKFYSYFLPRGYGKLVTRTKYLEKLHAKTKEKLLAEMTNEQTKWINRMNERASLFESFEDVQRDAMCRRYQGIAVGLEKAMDIVDNVFLPIERSNENDECRD